MKIIKVLSEKIEEEIKDAKDYIEMAIELKDEYPELSRTLSNLSAQEMEHMNILHNEVAVIIKKYRDTNGEPPAEMLAVYNYLHKRHIEDAKDVRMLQSMYKEN